MLSFRPLRFLRFRREQSCHGEGFRGETSSPGARLQDATACTAKMFCNQMEHLSECGGVSCLARSAVCQNVQHGKLSNRILTASTKRARCRRSRASPQKRSAKGGVPTFPENLTPASAL